MSIQKTEKNYEDLYKLIIRSCVANSCFSKELKGEIYKYLYDLETRKEILKELSKDLVKDNYMGYDNIEFIYEDYKEWLETHE